MCGTTKQKQTEINHTIIHINLGYSGVHTQTVNSNAKKKHRINGIQTNVPVHVCIQTYLYTFWETHLFGWWGKLKLLHHISHHAPHKYLKFGVRVGKVHRHTMGKKWQNMNLFNKTQTKTIMVFNSIQASSIQFMVSCQ